MRKHKSAFVEVIVVKITTITIHFYVSKYLYACAFQSEQGSVSIVDNNVEGKDFYCTYTCITDSRDSLAKTCTL